jgi:hypothetical protein
VAKKLLKLQLLQLLQLLRLLQPLLLLQLLRLLQPLQLLTLLLPLQLLQLLTLLQPPSKLKLPRNKKADASRLFYCSKQEVRSATMFRGKPLAGLQSCSSILNPSRNNLGLCPLVVRGSPLRAQSCL